MNYPDFSFLLDQPTYSPSLVGDDIQYLFPQSLTLFLVTKKAESQKHTWILDRIVRVDEYRAFIDSILPYFLRQTVWVIWVMTINCLIFFKIVYMFVKRIVYVSEQMTLSHAYGSFPLFKLNLIQSLNK